MSDKPIVELMAAARQQHDRICEDEYGVHPDCAIVALLDALEMPCRKTCRWSDRNYVARFVRQHGRAPEYCTRCEQWEGICWHHPTNQPVPTQENETR